MLPAIASSDVTPSTPIVDSVLIMPVMLTDLSRAGDSCEPSARWRSGPLPRSERLLRVRPITMLATPLIRDTPTSTSLASVHARAGAETSLPESILRPMNHGTANAT